MTLAGQAVPFGVDMIFAASDLPDFIFHVEICEDYWAPIPPSSYGALAGATILCNLSASNIAVGKARQRGLLASAQAMRSIAAYIYSAAGPGESTTDLAWDRQRMIYEQELLLAESGRFVTPEQISADVDVQRLRLGGRCIFSHLTTTSSIPTIWPGTCSSTSLAHHVAGTSSVWARVLINARWHNMRRQSTANSTYRHGVERNQRLG